MFPLPLAIDDLGVDKSDYTIKMLIEIIDLWNAASYISGHSDWGKGSHSWANQCRHLVA